MIYWTLFTKEFASLLHEKTPNNPFLTCLISSKTITGRNLANDSDITFGYPSVYEGKIKILDWS